MNCPECNGDTAVVDCRPQRGGSSFRRRRECLSCKARFTTVEEIRVMVRGEYVSPGEVALRAQCEALALELERVASGMASRASEALAGLKGASAPIAIDEPKTKAAARVIRQVDDEPAEVAVKRRGRKSGRAEDLLVMREIEGISKPGYL